MTITTIGDAGEPVATVEEPNQEGHGRLSRGELLALCSSIMAMMAVGIDLLLPAFDSIETAYGLQTGSGELPQIITVFFFGLAFAQLVYGPLADSLGRKPVLYLSITIFIAGAIVSAFAPTFGWLLVGRFVWGIGAAGARVIAVAIVRDRFEGVSMAKAMSQMMAVFVLVPVFAPVIGAGIIGILPWRSLFWVSAIFAALVAGWSLRLSETLDPVNQRPLNFGTTARGYLQVVRTPITFGYTIAAMFIQGAFTAYLSASESIIDEVFDLGSMFPFIFGAVAVGFGIAAVINGGIVERLGIDGVVNRTFAATIPLSVLLVVISVLTDGNPSIWVYMPILGLILSSFMFLMPNLGAASMVPVGDIAGSASAFTGGFRIAGGALLATLIASRVEASTTGFAIWVLASCVATGLSVAIVRRRSTARQVVVASSSAAA